MTAAEAIATQLERVVGTDRVRRWEALDIGLRANLAAATAEGVIAVAYPSTIQALSELVTLAHRDRFAMLPFGSGSKLSWGGSAKATIAISTAHLNRIVEHAVGDLTLTAEAGTTLSNLRALLSPHQQQLGLDPAYADIATLGGAIATADTGSLRQRYGSVRDMLLGVTFVRHDGQVVKAGGRVVKNVAGYDLMKLLAGSYGTLGISAQLTLRVYPQPEQSRSLLLVGSTAAIAALARQLRCSSLTPTAIDLLSASIVKALGHPSATGLLVQFQSIPSSIDAQIEQVLNWARALKLSSELASDADETHLWATVRQALHLDVPASPDELGTLIACKFGILPSRAGELVARLESLAAARARIHASSGIGWLHLDREAIAPDTLRDLRSFCQANGGYLSILQAPRSFEQQLDIWGYAEGSLALMQAIAHRFDPHALLSPNRLFQRD
ncbi:FAD-binding oxidoreductase [Synechococcus sp. PCC 7336]|uniref:FAD-binding oxidoreductase n=1 Tax=Synechococcus sp. PCC 7336 TaxID=195250 RepID=UPI000476DB39|nr:FAD-binding oxidoreductase [Synechococcus sp. PCC 7336]